MIKKMFFFSLFAITFANAFCCPQSCDPEINSAFNALKKTVIASYKQNLMQLNALLLEYDNTLNQETKSLILLNKYLQRLEIEFINNKKAEFETQKNVKIKGV